MAADWTEVPLGDFVRLQRGHDLTSTERRPGKVPVMGSGGQNGWHDEAKALGPGVVIGRSGVGSMGAVHYCAEDYWPHNTTLYVTDFCGNDPLFTYYLLSTVNFRAFDSGSAQASLNRNYLNSIRLRRPRKAEQSAIASILRTFEDKIELNRRVNETLEAMTRALFKSWFVDFDPVRAKSEGRTPNGMDAEAAKRFPSELVDSELGPIPKGWKVTSIGEVAEEYRQTVQPRDLPAATPYIGLEHMPQKSISLGDWGQAVDVQSQKTRFDRDDILFGKLRPYFHKVGVAPVDGVCSTDIVVVRPTERAWFGLALGHLSSDVFVAFTNAGSDGTRMPRTSWTRMASYSIVMPDAQCANMLTDFVRPVVESIRKNVFQSRCLRELRDALLPRLLSGEISVRALENGL